MSGLPKVGSPDQKCANEKRVTANELTKGVGQNIFAYCLLPSPEASTLSKHAV